MDTGSKTISLKGGRMFHYDKCIYALGASSFIPPIEGAQDERVKTIRTLSDVATIQDLICDKKRVVLIGGGILGLEAAWELSKAGKDVTVLEAMDRLMPRQLDAQASQMVRQTAEKHGLHMMTGVKITKITGDGEERTVHTETGKYLCDLVIISAGVRANVILAKDAGMECERAVVVNAKMETSAADVYACGDCAQYNGLNYALWSQALEEGRIAGANAAGDALEYEPGVPALTFFGLDTQLFAAGDLGGKPDQQYKTLEIKDEARGIYRKAYFLNSQLCGVALVGDISKMRELGAAMKEQKSFADTAALLG